ncbi:MAG: hypothetical protein FJ225_09600 [Lentisphaerae bacterium]|nr:hypothetical protein [Lentisphaerota bacterium]
MTWYLADRTWPEPNFQLLNAGLEQMKWAGPALDAGNWRSILRARLDTLQWDAALADVRPFLEREADLGLLTRKSCLALLENP